MSGQIENAICRTPSPQKGSKFFNGSDQICAPKRPRSWQNKLRLCLNLGSTPKTTGIITLRKRNIFKHYLEKQMEKPGFAQNQTENTVEETPLLMGAKGDGSLHHFKHKIFGDLRSKEIGAGKVINVPEDAKQKAPKVKYICKRKGVKQYIKVITHVQPKDRSSLDEPNVLEEPAVIPLDKSDEMINIKETIGVRRNVKSGKPYVACLDETCKEDEGNTNVREREQLVMSTAFEVKTKEFDFMGDFRNSPPDFNQIQNKTVDAVSSRENRNSTSVSEVEPKASMDNRRFSFIQGQSLENINGCPNLRHSVEAEDQLEVEVIEDTGKIIASPRPSKKTKALSLSKAKRVPAKKVQSNDAVTEKTEILSERSLHHIDEAGKLETKSKRRKASKLGRGKTKASLNVEAVQDFSEKIHQENIASEGRKRLKFDESWVMAANDSFDWELKRPLSVKAVSERPVNNIDDAALQSNATSRGRKGARCEEGDVFSPTDSDNGTSIKFSFRDISFLQESDPLQASAGDKKEYEGKTRVATEKKLPEILLDSAISPEDVAAQKGKTTISGEALEVKPTTDVIPKIPLSKNTMSKMSNQHKDDKDLDLKSASKGGRRAKYVKGKTDTGIEIKIVPESLSRRPVSQEDIATQKSKVTSRVRKGAKPRIEKTPASLEGEVVTYEPTSQDFLSEKPTQQNCDVDTQSEVPLKGRKGTKFGKTKKSGAVEKGLSKEVLPNDPPFQEDSAKQKVTATSFKEAGVVPKALPKRPSFQNALLESKTRQRSSRAKHNSEASLKTRRGAKSGEDEIAAPKEEAVPETKRARTRGKKGSKSRRGKIVSCEEVEGFQEVFDASSSCQVGITARGADAVFSPEIDSGPGVSCAHQSDSVLSDRPTRKNYDVDVQLEVAKSGKSKTLAPMEEAVLATLGAHTKVKQGTKSRRGKIVSFEEGKGQVSIAAERGEVESAAEIDSCSEVSPVCQNDNVLSDRSTRKNCDVAMQSVVAPKGRRSKSGKRKKSAAVEIDKSNDVLPKNPSFQKDVAKQIARPTPIAVSDVHKVLGNQEIPSLENSVPESLALQKSCGGAEPNSEASSKIRRGTKSGKSKIAAPTEEAAPETLVAHKKVKEATKSRKGKSAAPGDVDIAEELKDTLSASEVKSGSEALLGSQRDNLESKTDSTSKVKKETKSRKCKATAAFGAAASPLVLSEEPLQKEKNATQTTKEFPKPRNVARSGKGKTNTQAEVGVSDVLSSTFIVKDAILVTQKGDSDMKLKAASKGRKGAKVKEEMGAQIDVRDKTEVSPERPSSHNFKAPNSKVTTKGRKGAKSGVGKTVPTEIESGSISERLVHQKDNDQSHKSKVTSRGRRITRSGRGKTTAPEGVEVGANGC